MLIRKYAVCLSWPAPADGMHNLSLLGFAQSQVNAKIAS